MNIASLLSSTRYRISVLMLTIVCACGIFYVTLHVRPCLDPTPLIKPITPEKYNSWAQYADQLNAGIYITNFAVADFGQGLFVIDAFVWFKYNPLVFSLDTIGRFSFDKGKILEKSYIDSEKIGGHLVARYRVRFETKSNLNFKYFPFDNHRIHAVVKYDELSPSEVIVTSYFSTTWFGDNAVSLNWAYGEPASDFGYLESLLNTRNKNNVLYTSAATFYFDLQRATLREGLLIVVPIVSLFFILLGSLLIALNGFQSIVLAILSLIGIILYRTITNHMAPPASYYLMSDLIFFLIIGCALLVLIAQLINGLYKNEEDLSSDALRGGVLTLVSIVFLVGWFYILYMW